MRRWIVALEVLFAALLTTIACGEEESRPTGPVATVEASPTGVPPAAATDTPVPVAPTVEVEATDTPAPPEPTATAEIAATPVPPTDTPPPPEPTAAAGEQTITVGDTVTGVPEGFDPSPFSMTLLSCMESEIAVVGPYITGYYTFTAQPGMRFVILQYRLTNDGVKQADTPYIDAGEVLTAPDGYFYRVWSPPVGVHSEEYAPRPSTQEEIDAILGDAGAFETLLPEESVTGRVVFEIPTDAEPVEAALGYVPAKIALGDHCRPQ